MNVNEITEVANFLNENINANEIPFDNNGNKLSKDDYISEIMSKLMMSPDTVSLLSSPEKYQFSNKKNDITSGNYEYHFDLGVAEFDIVANYDLKDFSGSITITSSLYGLRIGTAKVEFLNGVLHRKETIDAYFAKVEYDFNIDFRHGISGGIYIKGEIDLGGYKKEGSWKLEF